MRVPTPLLDTPTVVVVPGAVIEQQRAPSVTPSRNVSGITISAGEGGRQGDTFIIRGFSAQQDVFRDGIRDLGWFTRDTFNIQNVEVYFGPSAALRAWLDRRGGQPRDQDTDQHHQRVGQHPGRDRATGAPEGDVNVALTDAFQFQLDAMGQLSGVPDRNEASASRAGVAPSVRWRLAERTTLELDYFYQHERNTPDYGHPYYAPAPGQDGYPVSYNLGVPRQAWYGVAGDDLPDLENVNANIGTLRLRQGFGDRRVLGTLVAGIAGLATRRHARLLDGTLRGSGPAGARY